jgi:RNA polymerase sigma-54 factor
MRLVGQHAVRRQEAFIRGGVTLLRPLTRAQVARELQLHESTVSRAVANRNVQLPSGAVIPMSNLFRGSLRLQDEIRQVIASERFPMSDDQIAAVLALRGHPVARRTVAKHRDALGIPRRALR